jgi:hypothetical protein
MKPLRQAVASGVAAIIVLFAGSSLLGQDVALRYRWNKGEALRYRMVQETTIAMSGIPGMGEMNITNTMTQIQKMTAQDVAADGTATVQALFESVKMEMGTPMGNFVYDSTAPAQNNADPMVAQVAGMMGALVGESITIVMSPTGAIQKTEGMTRIVQKMQQSPQAAAAGLSGLENMLSDDSMKGSFGQSLANLPEKPVKTGDTWKSDLSMPNPFGTMNIATTYTLKGTESTGGHDFARITSTSAVKATASGKSPFPMPMTMEFGDGTGQGEMVFDRKLGRTQQATMSMTMPMSMNMTTPDGQSISLQALTKTTTKMELIEK